MKGLTLFRWIGCWPTAIISMWGAAALIGIVYFAITAALNLGNQAAIQERMWFVYGASGWCGGFCGSWLGLRIAPSKGKRITLAMRVVLTSVVALLAAGDVLAKDWWRLFQEAGFLGAIWTTSSLEEAAA